MNPYFGALRFRVIPTPRTGGPAGVPPAPGAVSLQIYPVADDYWTPAGTADQTPPADAKALAQQDASDYVESLWIDGDPSEKFYTGLDGLVQFGILRTGASPTLELMDQTPGAETLLVPGIEALLKCLPLVRRVAPNSLLNLDMKETGVVLQRLKDNQRTIDILLPWLYGLLAQRSQYRVYLFNVARTAYWNGIAAEMPRNWVLNRDALALKTLVTWSAQQAVESGRQNGRLVDAVLAEIAGHAPAPPPAAPPPVVQPPPATVPGNGPVMSGPLPAQGPATAPAAHHAPHGHSPKAVPAAPRPGSTGTRGTRRPRTRKPAQ